MLLVLIPLFEVVSPTALPLVPKLESSGLQLWAMPKNICPMQNISVIIFFIIQVYKMNNEEDGLNRVMLLIRPSNSIGGY
jgi:hypothetical protein